MHIPQARLIYTWKNEGGVISVSLGTGRLASESEILIICNGSLGDDV